MTLLVKSSLRYIYKNKARFVLSTIFILIIMLLFTSIDYASIVFKETTFNAVRMYQGDIIVNGIIPRSALDELRRRDYTADLSCLWLKAGYTEINGVKYSVVLVYSNTMYNGTLFKIVYDAIPRKGEALIYKPLRHQFKDISYIDVTVFDEYNESRNIRLKIIGTYDTLFPFSGGDIVLVISSEDYLGLGGSYCNAIALKTAPGTETTMDSITGDIKAIVEEKGGLVNEITVVKRELVSEMVKPIDSMSMTLRGLSYTALVVFIVVTLALTILSLENDARMVGILKVVGCSRKQILMHYSIANMLRYIIAVTLALILAKYTGIQIVLVVLQGFGDAGKLLLEAIKPIDKPYFYITNTTLLLTPAIIASIVPGIFTSRISTMDAINFYSILRYGEKPEKKTRPSLKVSRRLWLKMILSRPWKIFSYIVMLIIVLTTVFSMIEFNKGIDSRINDLNQQKYSLKLYLNAEDYNNIVSILDTMDAKALLLNISTIPFKDAITTIFYFNKHKWTDYSIFPPLERGRYPLRRGEAVITTTLYKIYGINIGDHIDIGDKKYVIVGIVRFYYNNGKSIIVYDNESNNIQSILLYLFIPSDTYDINKIKELFLENGVSIKYIYTKEQDVAETMSSNNLIKTVVGSLLLMTTMVSLIGFLLFLLIDLNYRRRELSVLKIVGVSSTNITLGIASSITPLLIVSAFISIPLSMLLADYVSVLTADAYGYSRPILPDPLWMLAIVIIIIVITISTLKLYSRTIRSSEVFRELV